LDQPTNYRGAATLAIWAKQQYSDWQRLASVRMRHPPNLRLSTPGFLLSRGRQDF